MWVWVCGYVIGTRCGYVIGVVGVGISMWVCDRCEYVIGVDM